MDKVIVVPGAGTRSVPQPINVAALIDRHPMSLLQIRIVVLCGLAALFDGFDLLAIGVAAPAMARPLGIAPAQLGTLFSAALLGLILGAFGLGPVADRVGRRPLLIGATALFGAFTLSTAYAATLQQVLLFRFLAGVGLGAAMPGFISLAVEYTPRSRRRQVVALLWTGFPLGGALVSLLASWLIPAEGWRALFVIGGVLSLGLAAVLLGALPESVAFLVRDGTAGHRARDLLMRMVPSASIGPETDIVCLLQPTEAGVRSLFQEGRARVTGLLWGSYFATFLMLITSTAWAPTLLERSGLERGRAAQGVALFALGSVIGTPLAGLLLTRFGTRNILPTSLLCGALAICVLGIAEPSPALVLTCLTCAGFCLGVASSGLIALAPLLYPTRIRSTAVGWAMGWGRAGSFAGPLAIGTAVSAGWSTGAIFAALCLPGLAGGLLTAWLSHMTRTFRDE